MTASLFLLAFALVALICCGLAYWYACWRQLVDLPGERRSHQIPTPRGGGAGIVLAMILVLIVGSIIRPEWRLFISLSGLAVLLVAGIGWWDDHRPLPAMLRLCVHLLSAVLVGLALWLQGYGLLAFGAALVLVPVMINFWNFMDGINGLVVSQVCLSGLVMALFLPADVAAAGLCLAIACLVFLPMNFPQAKIFLGDVGSGALGLMLAILTLLAMFTGWGSGDFLLPLIVLLPLGMDAGLTLIYRFGRGEKLTQAHREHLYQWGVRSGFSHGLLTGMYFLLLLLLSGVAVAFRGTVPLGGVLVLTMSICASALIWFIARSWIRNKSRMM